MLTFWSLPLFSLLELCNKPREPLMTSENKPRCEVQVGKSLGKHAYSVYVNKYLIYELTEILISNSRPCICMNTCICLKYPSIITELCHNSQVEHFFRVAQKSLHVCIFPYQLPTDLSNQCAAPMVIICSILHLCRLSTRVCFCRAISGF